MQRQTPVSVRLPAQLHLQALRALERGTRLRPHAHRAPWQQPSPGLKLMHFALVAEGLLTDVSVAAGPRAARDAAAVSDSLCVMPHVRRMCIQPSLGAPQPDVARLCAALARSPLPHLRHLCLSGHELDADATFALANGLAHSTALLSVSFSGNSAGQEGAEALIAVLSPITTLVTLDLRDNKVEFVAWPEPLPQLTPYSLRLTAAQPPHKANLLGVVIEWLASPHDLRHESGRLAGAAAALAATGGGTAAREHGADAVTTSRPPNPLALRAAFSHRCARAAAQSCMAYMLLLRVAPRLLGLDGVPVRVAAPIVCFVAVGAQTDRAAAWMQPHHSVAQLLTPCLILGAVSLALSVVCLRVSADPGHSQAFVSHVAEWKAVVSEHQQVLAVLLAIIGGGQFSFLQSMAQHAALAAAHRSHWLQDQPGKLCTLVATAVSTYPLVEHGLGAGLMPASVVWLTASDVLGAVERCVWKLLPLRTASQRGNSGIEALTAPGQKVSECVVICVVSLVCLFVVPEFVAMLRTVVDLALLTRCRQLLCAAARRHAAQQAEEARNSPSRLGTAVASYCVAFMSRSQYILAAVYVVQIVAAIESSEVMFNAALGLQLIWTSLLFFTPQLIRLRRNGAVLERTTVLMVTIGFATGLATAVLIMKVDGAAMQWNKPIPQAAALAACVMAHKRTQRHHARWRWVSLISAGQESERSLPPRRPDALDGRAQAGSVGPEDAQSYAAAVAECNARLDEASCGAMSSSSSSSSLPSSSASSSSPSAQPRHDGETTASPVDCCALGTATAAAASVAVNACAHHKCSKCAPPFDVDCTPGLFDPSAAHSLAQQDALGASSDPAIALVAAAAVRARALWSAATAPASPAVPQQGQRQQQLHIDLRDNPIDDHATLRLMYLLASALPLSHTLHGTVTLSVHSASLAESMAAAAVPPPRRDEAPPTAYVTSAQHDWYVATRAEPSRAHALQVVPSWDGLADDEVDGAPRAWVGNMQWLRDLFLEYSCIHKYQVHV